MPTQQEYNVTKQLDRILRARFEILNYQFQTVGNLEGIVIGSPSFSNDSNSNIRRTCNIQIYMENSSVEISPSSKLWIDKYVKVYLGIYDNVNDEFVETNMGIYLINNPSQVYSATENTITINGLDLMARLTGLRNGNLQAIEHLIPQGSDVRGLLISTIALFEFTDYIIESYPIQTPYEININVGGTAWNIIEEILNILPNWQAYFDVDGIFHFEQIPNGINEQIMVDDDLWQDILISYNKSYDYENIKNHIEVLGKAVEDTNYCATTTLSGGVYIGTSATVTSLYNFLMVSFTTPNTVSTTPYFNLNSYGSKAIKNEDGTIPTLEADTYYIIEYIEDGDYFKFLSGVQPFAISEETNPESPFYINNDAGILRIVLNGGDFDNINSDYLAKQRANFELYQRCRLKDNVVITCMPAYWLDTNWLIEITLPNKQGIEETNKYLIKSINTSFGMTDTQSINLMRYYPYYGSI